MNLASVRVETDPPYEVAIGPGALGAARRERAARTALICDERAAALHRAGLAGFDGCPELALPAGEAAKDLAVLARALDFLAASELDRASRVVVLGGGAACDLGGFAASVYLRGIEVVLCPTTLLAQVDASVGGKTAVNLAAGKNLAGTFHQPRAVFTDTSVLATLDEREYRSGLGEVVKAAILDGPELFARVEALTPRLVARDAGALQEVVAACVRFKARVVASDERERGPRRALNLGHTFAHAIEHAAGYGAIPHGVAVAAGISLALEASRAAGVLDDRELPRRVGALLARLGLPASLAELRRESGRALAADELCAAMRLDKKSRDARPRLVLPRALGRVEIDVEVEPAAALRA